MRPVDKDEVEELKCLLNIQGEEVGVFWLYREVSANAMLFENNAAKRKLGNPNHETGLYGTVIETIELKDIAEERGIYTLGESIRFLEDLKKTPRAGYSAKVIDKELKKYH